MDLTPFLDWLQAQDRSARTVRAYRVAMQDYAAWFEARNGGTLTPERVTPLDVRSYRRYLLKERKRKPTTINNYLAGLRAYLRWARAVGKIARDPSEGIKGVQQVEAGPRVGFHSF